MSHRNPGFPPTTRLPAAPPRPAAAFHWTVETWGRALRAEPLGRHTQHLFTSSQLQLPTQADEETRRRAWRHVAGSLGVEPDRLFRVRQVHGREVRIVRAADVEGPAGPTTVPPDGDAVVSDVPGVALAVVVADCVPVLIVDPKRGAAAAVHAGWRGTAAGVTTAAVQAMTEHWGSRPSDLVAAIGPSIGPDDYEVGESLVEAFREAGHAASVGRWFQRSGDRLRLDLWRANREQLEATGVPAASIVTAGLSTAAHPGWLESFRRDGAGAGRLVAAIVVPPAASVG